MKVLFKQKLFTVLCTVMLAACNGGTVTISSTGAGGTSVDGSSSGASVSLTLDTFQTVAKASWNVDGSNNLYTSNSTLAATGTCSRGIASINVYIGNVSSGSATCSLAGTYSWTAPSASADNTYTVRFTPVAGNGKEYVGADVSQVVVVDTAVPAAPVITSGTTTNTPTNTITGTVASSVYQMIASDTSGTLNYTTGNTSWNAVYTMTANQTTTYTFYAKSRTGLTSAGASVTVTYLVTNGLTALAENGASVVTPITSSGGSTNKLHSLTVSPYLFSANTLTGSDGKKLGTGVIRFAY